MPITTIIVNIFSILIFWFFSFSIMFSKLKIGMLLALIQYISISLSSIVSILDIIKIWPKTRVSIIRLYDILSFVPVNTSISKSYNYISKLINNKWEIIFKDVTFSYPNNKVNTLKNVSFTIEKKKITAIIGSTGSGKSTIINLILKFYDRYNGKILINNIDIKDINENFLRENISWVSQQSILFSGTIKSNIL